MEKAAVAPHFFSCGSDSSAQVPRVGSFTGFIVETRMFPLISCSLQSVWVDVLSFSLYGYMSLSFMVPATPAWLPFFFFFWLPLNLALVTSMLPSVLSWEPWEPSLKDRMASSGNQFSVLFSNFPLRVVNLSSWSSELILGLSLRN